MNKKFQQLLWMVLLGVVIPGFAHATTNSIATVLCEVVAWLWGPIGSVTAMLAVIVLGITAMFGKIAIPNILITMAGIAMIFGAPGILQNLGLTPACVGTSPGSILSSKLYLMLACITTWFNGPYGKALATLAVIVLGLFSVNGRISYHQAIIVGAGIATIMGSVSIVHTMGVPVRTSSGIGLFEISLLGGCSTRTAFEYLFCNVILWFQGGLAKGIATLAIVVLGLGAMFGKIGWGVSIVAGVGIALLMGSVSIVDSLGAGNVANCQAARDITDGSKIRWINSGGGGVVTTIPSTSSGGVTTSSGSGGLTGVNVPGVPTSGSNGGTTTSTGGLPGGTTIPPLTTPPRTLPNGTVIVPQG